MVKQLTLLFVLIASIAIGKSSPPEKVVPMKIDTTVVVEIGGKPETVFYD